MPAGTLGKVAISQESGAEPRYFNGADLGDFSIGVGVSAPAARPHACMTCVRVPRWRWGACGGSGP
jgi:hypothetical protein